MESKPQYLEVGNRNAIARTVTRTVDASLSNNQRESVLAKLYHRIVRDVERPLLDAALIATRGHQIGAVRLLGISRDVLRKNPDEGMVTECTLFQRPS
jgi:DNA-binding protein Fis